MPTTTIDPAIIKVVTLAQPIFQSQHWCWGGTDVPPTTEEMIDFLSYLRDHAIEGLSDPECEGLSDCESGRFRVVAEDIGGELSVEYFVQLDLHYEAVPE